MKFGLRFIQLLNLCSLDGVQGMLQDSNWLSFSENYNLEDREKDGIIT